MTQHMTLKKIIMQIVDLFRNNFYTHVTHKTSD